MTSRETTYKCDNSFTISDKKILEWFIVILTIVYDVPTKQKKSAIIDSGFLDFLAIIVTSSSQESPASSHLDSCV